MYLTSNRGNSKSCPKICVLVVDDNEAFLQATTDFLARHPGLLVVGAVCEYGQALTQARYSAPQVVLIGLDGIGLETIARLRKALSGIKIIALTLADGDAYRQVVIDAGADALVCKEALVTDLIPTIERIAL